MGDSVKKADTIFSVLMPQEAVTLSPEAFDAFLHHYGVRLLHFRAIPCPIGLQTPNDIRRTHDDHSGCDNGFIYQLVGRFTGTFLSNATQIRKLDAGFVDGSSVSITVPRFYDHTDKQRILVRPYDRIYLEEDDITTAATNITSRRLDGRPDKPAYPAVVVHTLIDSSGISYRQGIDFSLDHGDLIWADSRGPVPGTPYSIWFEYKPYYYVDRLAHEIRVVPKSDYLHTNTVHNERLSFAIICNREFVHRNKTPDILSPDIGGRQSQVPDQSKTEPGVNPTFG